MLQLRGEFVIAAGHQRRLETALSIARLSSAKIPSIARPAAAGFGPKSVAMRPW